MEDVGPSDSPDTVLLPETSLDDADVSLQPDAVVSLVNLLGVGV